MIAITPQMHILLATEPVDFRKGIDGLAGYVRNILDKDPFNGYVFVFSNIKRTSIKILTYDGQGLWLCQKRLSKGRITTTKDVELINKLMNIPVSADAHYQLSFAKPQTGCRLTGICVIW